MMVHSLVVPLPHLFQLRPYCIQVRLRQVPRFDAGAVAVFEKPEQFPHLFDGKTEVAAALDERQPLQVGLAVVAVAMGGAFCLGQQPKPPR